MTHPLYLLQKRYLVFVFYRLADLIMQSKSLRPYQNNLSKLQGLQRTIFNKIILILKITFLPQANKTA